MNEQLLATLKAKSEQKAQELLQKDGPMRRAEATALPGPLADAFALAPNIVVGPFSVRPVFDIDFEFLSVLKHPLDTMVKDLLQQEKPTAMFLPTGPAAWQAFWIFTHSVDEVENLLASPEGVEQLNHMARKQFGRLSTAAMVELFKAVMTQVQISSSTVVQLEAADQITEENEGRAPTSNPSTPLPATG